MSLLNESKVGLVAAFKMNPEKAFAAIIRRFPEAETLDGATVE
jgi:hypothetical protein